MKFKIEDTDELEIIAYLKGEKEAISKKSAEQIERYTDADRLLNQFGSRNTVVKMLMKKYNYGRTQAFKDINAAQYFFGEVTKPKKEYYRKFLIDHYAKAFVKALKNEEYKAAASIGKEIRLTLGLHLADNELPDWSQLKIPQTIIGFFPHLTNVSLPPTDELKQSITDLVSNFRGVNIDDVFKNIEPTEFIEEKTDESK